MNVLRGLSTDSIDLFVLEETPDHNWRITRHPKGYKVIRSKVEEYFGTDLYKSIHIPINRSGLDQWTFAHFISQGVPIEENSLKAEQFYENFVDEYYLKADLDVGLREFLSLRCDNEVLEPSPRIRERTERIEKEIIKHPYLTGILEQNGIFFREVAFSNRFSSLFSNWAEMDRYLKLNQEPTERRTSGLVKPDLTYITKDFAYIIEIKTSVRKRIHPESMKKFSKQKRLCSEFIARNFDVEFRVILANYCENSKMRKFRYEHHTFNPEKKACEEVLTSNWIDI